MRVLERKPRAVVDPGNDLDDPFCESLA